MKINLEQIKRKWNNFGPTHPEDDPIDCEVMALNFAADHFDVLIAEIEQLRKTLLIKSDAIVAVNIQEMLSSSSFVEEDRSNIESNLNDILHNWGLTKGDQKQRTKDLWAQAENRCYNALSTENIRAIYGQNKIEENEK